MSDKIRYARLKKGLTQVQLAKLVNLSNDTIKRLENSNKEVTAQKNYLRVQMYVKIANALNLEIQEILNEYELFLLNYSPALLKSYRKANKLTQSNFAKLIDVSAKTIRTWENNKNTISYNNYLKLKRLGVIT